MAVFGGNYQFSINGWGKVAKKVWPIATDLPKQYRIVRRPHPNPLEGMPELPVCLPVFRPGERFTQERYKELDVDPDGFLWEEE